MLFLVSYGTISAIPIGVILKVRSSEVIHPPFLPFFSFYYFTFYQIILLYLILFNFKLVTGVLLFLTPDLYPFLRYSLHIVDVGTVALRFSPSIRSWYHIWKALDG